MCFGKRAMISFVISARRKLRDAAYVFQRAALLYFFIRGRERHTRWSSKFQRGPMCFQTVSNFIITARSDYINYALINFTFYDWSTFEEKEEKMSFIHADDFDTFHPVHTFIHVTFVCLRKTQHQGD